MRIGVYLKGKEPIFKEIRLPSLLVGERIYDALNVLGVQKSRFVRGFVEVTDSESGITIKQNFKNFEDFVNMLWYLRQKMRKKSKSRSKIPQSSKSP